MQDRIINLAETFPLHETQKIVDEAGARITVVKAPRRWGKDFYGDAWQAKIYLMLRDIERPKQLVPRIWQWVVAPTERDVLPIWRELKEYMPEEWIVNISEDRLIMELVGDCVIEFRSADDPLSLTGAGLDALRIVEPGRMPDEVWHQVEPMLHSPFRLGCAYIAGVPHLEGNWFERLYDAGQKENNLGIKSWHYTFYDNPLLDHAAILESLEVLNTPEDVFRREYLAETLADESRAFRNWESCVQGDLLEPESGRSYVMGVDLGKSVDFTVLTVMDRERRKVVGWHRMGKLDWPIQKATIIEWAQKWNNAKVYVDATGLGNPIFADLKQDISNIVGLDLSSLKKKADIMDNLRLAIERETIRFPAISQLTKELKMCRRISTGRTGKALSVDRIEAPRGFHDDSVDSLAYALQGCLPVLSGVTKFKPRRYMTF